MSKNKTPIESCSFCNKHKTEVKKLIVNPKVAICNECIFLCQEILDSKDVVKIELKEDI